MVPLSRPTRLAGAWRRLRRVVLARRRLLAALLAGVAVAAVVESATAPPQPAVGVLTAARDLPAGEVLDGDDLVEVGFAPPACKTQRVQGLVLIKLDDSPQAPRIVLGQGAWKWSDLLFARGA